MDQISGGEKQRVILARALAQQPLLLLLDEPTLHLDIAAQIGLLDSLRRLAAENRYTVVVVTHELNLAAEYADLIVLMQRGRCLRVGPPTSIYQRELLEQFSRRRSLWNSVLRRHGSPFCLERSEQKFFSLTPTLRPPLQITFTANFVLGKTGNRSAVALELLVPIFRNRQVVSRRRRATVRRIQLVRRPLRPVAPSLGDPAGRPRNGPFLTRPGATAKPGDRRSSQPCVPLVALVNLQLPRERERRTK